MGQTQQELAHSLPANSSATLQGVGAWLLLLVVGVVFAFVINTLFGHPTYHSIEHQPLLARTRRRGKQNRSPSSSSKHEGDQGRHARIDGNTSGEDGDGGAMGGRTHVFHKARELPDAVMLHTFSYLTAHERLQLTQTAKACQRLADHPELWDQLLQLCATEAAKDVDAKARLQIEQLCAETACTKRGFFEAVHKLAPIATASHARNNPEDAYVIVHRRVYHLTSYMDEHPGGALIIRSYNGKDATKMYNRAFHSEVAKQLARKYVVWDPSAFIGAESGVPAFAKDAVVSGADGWLEPRSYPLQP